MLTQAAADLHLDLSRSWLIGDAQRDLDAGIAAGLNPSRCLRVWHPPTPATPTLTFAAACAQILYPSGA
jgi:histidinol phosphatase-like enzyme